MSEGREGLMVQGMAKTTSVRAERDWWFREWPRQQVTEGRAGLVVLRMAKTTSV